MFRIKVHYDEVLKDFNVFTFECQRCGHFNGVAVRGDLPQCSHCNQFLAQYSALLTDLEARIEYFRKRTIYYVTA